MNATRKRDLVAFKTIFYREVHRFMRIWTQTLLPPAITMSLYFIIFGHVIGSRIGNMSGYNYMQYIAPGLIMMSVITNSYTNVVFSFFSARFQRSIEEVLVSPTPNIYILLGYVFGAMVRAIIVGLCVVVVVLFFTKLQVHHVFITIATVLLSSILFALAGFINGLFAKKFDDTAIVPTFILMPLSYLGGVFYSIKLLPEFWYHVSRLNPILYMVNTFRYGILGVSDIHVGIAFTIIITFIVMLFFAALHLLNKGVGIRS